MTGSCKACRVCSKDFAVIELVDRWLVAHVAARHPQLLSSVRQRLLEGVVGMPSVPRPWQRGAFVAVDEREPLIEPLVSDAAFLKRAGILSAAPQEV